MGVGVALGVLVGLMAAACGDDDEGGPGSDAGAAAGQAGESSHDDGGAPGPTGGGAAGSEHGGRGGSSNGGSSNGGSSTSGSSNGGAGAPSTGTDGGGAFTPEGGTGPGPEVCALRDDFATDAPDYVKHDVAPNDGHEGEALPDTTDLIDDLEDDDLAIDETHGRVGGWWTYGSSGSTISAPSLTHAGGHTAVEVDGEQTPADVSILGLTLNDPPDPDPALPYDASAYSGLLVHFQGLAGTRVRVSLRTQQVVSLDDGGGCDPDLGACEDGFGFAWTFSGGLEEARVPFSALAQEGWGQAVAKDFSQTIALQFKVSSLTTDFDFAVDDVSFFTSPDTTSLRVNQLGYLTKSVKRAVLADNSATVFSLLDDEGNSVYDGAFSAAALWAPSGESAKLADFSDFVTPGKYRIAAGSAVSEPFSIGGNVFDDVSRALIKAYYFNRASTALTPTFAGVYARAAGHPDTAVLVHASAASPDRPAGSTISLPKGWYDAGDYGKYVVNASVATVTLLEAYEHYPARLGALRTSIPESSSALPDILGEARYNLDWLLAMQDPYDGGVYNEVVTQSFAPFVMPANDTAPRYVVGKTTSAALDFAAVMAHAARVYAPYDRDFSCAAMGAAVRAYSWAKAHTNVIFKLPSDFSAGGYDSTELGATNYDPEFYWAATELYASSGDEQYLGAIAAKTPASLRLPGWGTVEAFGALAVLDHAASFPKATRDATKAAWLTLADGVVSGTEASAFHVPITFFPWSSNSIAANLGLVALVAHELDGDSSYLDAAVDAADYILGRNGVGVSMVSGFGDVSPQHLHH
ncbi:MAG TPA: glycoside hydrolase family 9 protein, partial [Polyangiaceae bacterium]|nr:glycoside hydrolase family 9 protein [Polyangiaceae bacterium]